MSQLKGGTPSSRMSLLQAARICIGVAQRKHEAGMRAMAANRPGVASHRGSDADTAEECAKLIRAWADSKYPLKGKKK